MGREKITGAIIFEAYISYPDYAQNTFSYYIEKIQKKHIMIPKGNYFYTIYTVKIPKHENIIFGFFLKISKSMKGNFFDEKRWAPFEKETTDREIRYSNRFVIYPSDSAIIFEERPPYFSKTNFRSMFKELLEEAMKSEETIYHFELNIKKDIQTIFTFLEECDKIEKIFFEGLKKPNPFKFHDEKYQKGVEFIVRNNIKSLTMSNKEDDKGINAEGDETEGILDLVTNRGIGNAKIEGVKGDEKKYYNTRTKLKTKRVYYENDEDFVRKANEFKQSKKKKTQNDSSFYFRK